LAVLLAKYLRVGKPFSGIEQLPVISVTIIPELNLVYTSSFMLPRAAL
jgi:hypothetical protein